MKEHLAYFEQIEDYVEGRMATKEQQEFEASLLTNTALKKEYEAYLATQKMLDVLSYNTLKEHPVETEKTEPIRKRSWLPWLAAASILLASLGALWYANTNYTTNIIATQSYVKPKSNAIRGIESQNNSTYDKALEAFDEKDYSTAVNLLDDIPKSDKDYMNAQFLLGHTFYEIKQYTRSAVAFQEVLKIGDIRYVENANWNRAIAFLHIGKIEEAKVILKDITNHARHTYYHKAHQLLEDLDSHWRKIVF